MAKNSSPSPSPNKHEREYAEGFFQEANGHPTLREVVEKAEMIGLARWKAEDWFNEMQGCGWIDFQHRPVRDWAAVLTRVKTKWESDGRPSSPPKPRAATSAGGQSVFELKEIIKAKEAQCLELKRHCSEVAGGEVWSDAAARKKYFDTRREIKQLNARIASAA